MNFKYYGVLFIALFVSIFSEAQTFSLTDTIKIKTGFPKYYETKFVWDTESFRLNRENEIILDSLISFLQINPSIIIEITVYPNIFMTVDSLSYNLHMAQKILQSVVAYLMIKDVDPSRLVAAPFTAARKEEIVSCNNCIRFIIRRNNFVSRELENR